MASNIGDYYLGLDIGTSSLGWAVTDPEYNIPDYRRKAMWGIHLFDEGKTAKDRRMHRCARRRLNRRKQRITLLRELFSEEICKVDPAFFDRLDESGLHLEDRRVKQMNSLFNDAGFTDADFHKRFPTVYHLRKYLMETDEKPDIRLVYLAAHHIIKYRGHFLFGDTGDDALPNFGEVLGIFIENLEQYGMDLHISNVKELSAVLTNRGMRISDKRGRLAELLGCNSDAEKEVANLLAGGKVTLSNIFGDESLKQEKLAFKESSAEDAMAELEDLLDPDCFQTLRLAKNIYDWSVLTGILKGHATLSDAKIAQYETHKNDLALLKKAVRRYAPDKYQSMFKAKNVKGNYCSYAGVCGKGKPEKYCTQKEFCDYCKGVLSKTGAVNDGEFAGMMERLQDSTFMPKQSSRENSILPYTVHRNELKSILENVSKHYAFLGEVGDDGFSVMQKVMSLQSFRVPYFVGPLGRGASNAWAVRRSNERIYPWNFDKVVDLDASAEGFIENLRNFCTYLVGEKVLPKKSILYSYFQLYNELNNVEVDGEKLPVGVKRRMVDGLFRKASRKVTGKEIVRFLASEGLIDPKEEHSVKGFDQSIKADLKSEQKLRSIIGDKVENRRLAEDVIRTITVFEGEPRIKAKLKKDHGSDLSDEEIKKLSKLTFEGWGRLSEKFLTGLYDTCRETGQELNIMGMLESTQDNLEQIYNKYSFGKQVDEHNRRATSDELSYKTLDAMYLSPAVKRGVWRTVAVARDILESVGHPPKKVFVETTREVRGANEGKRKDSRKKALEELYKACNEDSQWTEELSNTDEARFKSRNVYLYYTQLGRCMYCGRQFRIEDLDNNSVVDRDHIYPQSKIKDDSIHNNLVLVCSRCNKEKSNVYPIRLEWQQKMRPFWDELKSKGYITAEKYSRLVRTKPFDEDELARFISRQIVETGQSVKASVEVLKKLFGGDTDIVYVRASQVSEFRQEYKFVKCRSVNDLHHAKDAYLNIVVGNVHDTKFTKSPSNFLKTKEPYNIGKMYEHDVSRNGTVAWKAGEDGSIATVKKYMRRNNILFTRHQYIDGGKLFDDNLVRAKDTLYDRKVGRPAGKYGGYNTVKNACFSLVECQSKKGAVRSIEALPVHKLQILGDNVALNSYFTDKLGKETKVIIPVIRKNALFDLGGYRAHIAGCSSNGIEIHPAVQLILPEELYSYCKKLYKYGDDKKQKISHPANYYEITEEMNISLFKALYDKCDVPPFRQRMGFMASNLDRIRESFLKSDLLIQADILNETLNAFQCNSVSSNFSKCGGPKEFGRMYIRRKEICPGAPIWIVDQSPSGLKERRTRICR